MDYTKLPLVFKVDDKEIKLCPYCGRNGLMEEVSGKIYYAHGQNAVEGPNHELQFVFFWCPKKESRHLFVQQSGDKNA